MTINQRLEEFTRSKKVDQSQIAKALNCSSQAVNQWFREGTSISVKMIERILNVYKDLNARWLITGEGQMLEGNNDSQNLNDPKQYYGIDIVADLRSLEREYGRLEERNKSLSEEILHLREDSGRELSRKQTRAG